MDFLTRTEQLEAGQRVVSVEGGLDLGTAPRFEAALLAALDRDVNRTIVDLSGCDFLDAVALSVLMRGSTRLSGSGPLAVVVSSAHLLRVIELARLTEVFAIHATRDSAAAASGG
jgi:anti-sigma B factor antagonist